MSERDDSLGGSSKKLIGGADGLTRRGFLLSSAAAALALGACKDEAPSPSPKPAADTNTKPEPQPTPPATAGVSQTTKIAGEVVLYCSADQELAQPLLDRFTKETGIVVKAVFDTEATKTTGLMNRLLSEKDRPRAEVWWSSEPFATIALAKAGVLETYTSVENERRMRGQTGTRAGAGESEAGWPKALRGTGGMWYGFGSRARVICRNTSIVGDDQLPVSFSTLNQQAFTGRIGMARPQFGTTRGLMVAMYATMGAPDFRQALIALRANGVKMYDGNASVVRGVATGEIHLGLTDSDDVFSGQRQGWPVKIAYEERIVPVGYRVNPGQDRSRERLANWGTLVLPNTIALVRGGVGESGKSAEGGTNPAAGRLIDFVLSLAGQRMLAESTSHNVPVDPELAKEFAEYAPPAEVIATSDYEALSEQMDDAMRIAGEILGR